MTPRIDAILALTDLSPREDMAVRRAGLLAAAHGARVRLMHVPSRQAPSAADAAGQLAVLAHRLEATQQVRVDCLAASGATPAQVAEAARAADVVVVCDRRAGPFGDLFGGVPVVRLLRDVPRPVLVVRSAPLANYLRVLAGVDLGPASQPLAQFARAVQPLARLELFHALSTAGEARLRLAEASERALRLYRRHCVELAAAQLSLLRMGVQSADDRVETGLGRGEAARALLARQQHAAADLIVLGRRRRSAWSEFFARSTTRDLLSWGRCDLLSVPDDGAAQGGAAAARARLGVGDLRPG